MQTDELAPRVRQGRRLSMPLRFVAYLSLPIALLLAPGIMFAQIAGSASIQGTVTDSTGAVVANAAVSLTDEATHVKRTTKSDGSGLYGFPGVPIGTYDLTVAAPGFKTYLQKGIVLEVGSSIAVNAGLSVGAADVQVEVSAEGLALQTEDATFKQTIDHTAVTEMPLNGRQMTALITASGGSSPAPGGDFTGSKYSYQTISVSIAGGGGNTTLWRFDGGDNQDYMANGNLPYLFPDAVAQFSVESTDLGAQDGGHVGGLVNVVTQSGTNQFHGSGFEFIRNNYIDATNFFSVSQILCTRTSLVEPSVAPSSATRCLPSRLTSAGRPTNHSRPRQATVPTAANLTGDWSVTDGDPVTGVNLCNSTGSPSRLLTRSPAQLWWGTSILPNRPIAHRHWHCRHTCLYQTRLLDPNNCGFVFYAIPYLLTDNQFVTRVDYTVSSKQNIYGRYFIDGYQFPAYFDRTTSSSLRNQGTLSASRLLSSAMPGPSRTIL